MKLFSLALSLAWAFAIGAAAPPRTEMTEPSPEFAHKPLVQDFYPETSRALGEQGTVKLRLCYDDKGRVTTSTLEQSSSFERLDRAALVMGKQYRIKPTLSGQTRPGCVVIPVEFILAGSVGPDRRGEGKSGTTLPLVPALPPPPPPVRPIPMPANPPPKLIPL